MKSKLQAIDEQKNQLQFTEAIKELEDIIPSLDPQYKAMALGWLGECYFQSRSDFNKAINSFQKALDDCVQHKDDEGIHIYYQVHLT